MTKKEQEQTYLTRFMESCRELDGATTAASESPDFISTVGKRSIGIEVTRLFHDDRFGKHEPRAVYSFREKIVERAKQLHASIRADEVHVGVLFEDYEIQDREVAALKLAKLIGAAAASRRGDFILVSDDLPELLPEFQIIRICRGAGSWMVTESQRAPQLTARDIQAALDEKSLLVPEYRTKAVECWLLLVLDRYPLAGSFSVPESTLSATYRTKFDRAYLLLSMECVSHRLQLE